MKKYIKKLFDDKPQGLDFGKIIFFSSFLVISSNADFFYHGWAAYLSKIQIKIMFFLSLIINIFFIIKFIINLINHFKRNNLNFFILKILFKPFIIWLFLVISYFFVEHLPFPAFFYLCLYIGFLVYLIKFIENFDTTIRAELKDKK